MSIRTIATALTVAALGCGDGSSADADGRDSQGDALSGSAPAAAPGATRGDDGRMTRENFSRFVDAAEALVRAASADRRLAEALELDDDENLEASAAKLRQHPRLVSVLRDHGFTPEQYFRYVARMTAAMFAQAALEGGHISEVPPTVDRADVQFIADNKDWFRERWARVEAATLDDDDASDDDPDYNDEGE